MIDFEQKYNELKAAVIKMRQAQKDYNNHKKPGELIYKIKCENEVSNLINGPLVKQEKFDWLAK